MGIAREGCGAKLTVVKDYKSGKGFIVSQFVEGHNHPLATPRKVHFLRSHRKISAAKRALAEQLALANVPPSQQMSILEMESGGLHNVGFLQRDLYNVARDKRKELDGLDVELLHENFRLKQENNPGFKFKFLLDGEGRMKHCFWADATMRDSYRYFGDVVVFDSTYNTNRYKLIFAPIVGVNHHGQTTLFGCAFLNDEKSESFEWLFQEWLKVMPAGPPKMIITDQCPAMIKAFAIVLPNTQHRYCIWHITRTSKDERVCLYKVQRGDSGAKGRELSFDKSSNLLTCSCKMFECDGISCRHMLAYFSRKQILKLPEL